MGKNNEIELKILTTLKSRFGWGQSNDKLDICYAGYPIQIMLFDFFKSPCFFIGFVCGCENDKDVQFEQKLSEELPSGFQPEKKRLSQSTLWSANDAQGIIFLLKALNGMFLKAINNKDGFSCSLNVDVLSVIDFSKKLSEVIREVEDLKLQMDRQISNSINNDSGSDASPLLFSRYPVNRAVRSSLANVNVHGVEKPKSVRFEPLCIDDKKIFLCSIKKEICGADVERMWRARGKSIFCFWPFTWTPDGVACMQKELRDFDISQSDDKGIIEKFNAVSEKLKLKLNPYKGYGHRLKATEEFYFRRYDEAKIASVIDRVDLQKMTSL